MSCVLNNSRYTASLTTDIREQEEPMMMMPSFPPNSDGHVIPPHYPPSTFSTNVQYLPDTLSNPVNAPFIRDVSQRHSRNYNPAQNINQARLPNTRPEGNIVEHYFNYHQNFPRQMVSISVFILIDRFVSSWEYNSLHV